MLLVDVGTASTCRLNVPVAGVVHVPFTALTVSETVLPASKDTLPYVGFKAVLLENDPFPSVVQITVAEPGVTVNGDKLYRPELAHTSSFEVDGLTPGMSSTVIDIEAEAEAHTPLVTVSVSITTVPASVSPYVYIGASVPAPLVGEKLPLPFVVHACVPCVEVKVDGVYVPLLIHCASVGVLLLAVGVASMVNVKVAVAGGEHALLLVIVRVTVAPLACSSGLNVYVGVKPVLPEVILPGVPDVLLAVHRIWPRLAV